jgi:hypothetical protein
MAESAEAEERKSRRTEAAWKAKKPQSRKLISLHAVEAGLLECDAAGQHVLVQRRRRENK